MNNLLAVDREQVGVNSRESHSSVLGHHIRFPAEPDAVEGKETQVMHSFTFSLARGRAVASGVLAVLGLVAGPTVASAVPTAPSAPGPAASGSVALQIRIDAQLHVAPGGKQIGANQIAWRDSAVIMTFPQSPTATAATCPSEWSCLFEHRDFGGRMLQFRDCGGWQFLDEYGFQNQTSSWDNKTARTVNVDDDDKGERLWNEAPRSHSSFVGSAKNDRADSLRIIC